MIIIDKITNTNKRTFPLIENYHSSPFETYRCPKHGEELFDVQLQVITTLH